MQGNAGRPRKLKIGMFSESEFLEKQAIQHEWYPKAVIQADKQLTATSLMVSGEHLVQRKVNRRSPA